jgi:hypothetical protein
MMAARGTCELDQRHGKLADETLAGRLRRRSLWMILVSLLAGTGLTLVCLALPF